MKNLNITLKNIELSSAGEIFELLLKRYEVLSAKKTRLMDEKCRALAFLKVLELLMKKC